MLANPYYSFKTGGVSSNQSFYLLAVHAEIKVRDSLHGQSPESAITAAGFISSRITAHPLRHSARELDRSSNFLANERRCRVRSLKRISFCD